MDSINTKYGAPTLHADRETTDGIATAKTQTYLCFILPFMLLTLYCMCILYRVLLYHMLLLFIGCSLCFTNPASWLP